MNEKNPIVNNTLPLVGLDAVLQTLAVQLAALPWLEKSWGRARTINGKLIKTKVNEPLIYLSSKEYYSVMPNDNFKAYSFWGVSSPQKEMDANNIPTDNRLLTANVFAIVWANLKAIDPAKDFIFTQELIKDVLGILSSNSSFTLTLVVDEKVEDIFKGYSLNEGQRDLLYYPYQAFRIEGVLNYKLNYC